MTRLFPLLLLALLASPLAAQPAADDDGFTDPLAQLAFDDGEERRVFLRSTFDAIDVPDPFGGLNRHIYHFNYGLDRWVLLPAVQAYRNVTPRPLRSGIGNFFNNLGDLGNLANSALQLKGRRSMQTTARLLFNTILGVGGLFDPATRMGLPRQAEDFGQTLGFYGVGPGPYLVLPVLGPSNLRDAGGLLVDFGASRAFDPLGYNALSDEHLALPVLRAIDIRHRTPFRYGQLNSPFEYEQVRYIYTRARDLQIAD